MTDSHDDPDQDPTAAAPASQRSPAEVARQVGDVVKAGTIVLGWALVATTSLAVTYIVVRALLWIVQLASRVFAP